MVNVDHKEHIGIQWVTGQAIYQKQCLDKDGKRAALLKCTIIIIEQKYIIWNREKDSVIVQYLNINIMCAFFRNCVCCAGSKSDENVVFREVAPQRFINGISARCEVVGNEPIQKGIYEFIGLVKNCQGNDK